VQWYGDARRLLGWDSFRGHYSEYLKHVHPDDVAAARATFLDCMKGKRPEYRATERIIQPDGQVRWLETYGRAEYGKDGRAVRMMGVIKDITERKRAEARLREKLSNEEVATVNASLARALAQLRVKRRVHRPS